MAVVFDLLTESDIEGRPLGNFGRGNWVIKLSVVKKLKARGQLTLEMFWANIVLVRGPALCADLNPCLKVTNIDGVGAYEWSIETLVVEVEAQVRVGLVKFRDRIKKEDG